MAKLPRRLANDHGWRAPLITVEPSLPLREAGEQMLRHAISDPVVVEPGTQLPIGILSTADIVGVLAWGEA